MNDIRFDLRYMNTVLSECNKTENQVSDSLFGMQKIAQKTENELSLFSGESLKALRDVQSYIFEIKDLMKEIDRKISAAEKQRKSESEIPPMPQLPKNATAEQRNKVMAVYRDQIRSIEEKNAEIRAKNQQIDEYALKAKLAIKDLEATIVSLQEIKESINKEIDAVSSKVHECIGQMHGVNNQNGRINSAMKEFNAAFKATYEDAEKLYLMEPREIKAYSFNHKQFEIKNTHEHWFNSGVNFNYSYDQEEIKVSKKEKITSSDELLIKDKDENAFFEKLNDAMKIKMPSANLHRLGGKKFIDKMNSLGYTLVKQPDGSTIDTNGILHWEKRYD